MLDSKQLLWTLYQVFSQYVVFRSCT